MTWGQVVGTDDASPVNVYTRADSSGAADQVARYLGGSSQADLKGTGVQGDPGVLDGTAVPGRSGVRGGRARGVRNLS